ncbi:hypothetical protein Arub01_31240 [Actinomadura rubrobrunea]|uniref:Pentapeptide repeat-containing protein n=1 Tax=Actinomadura rubrobrunea TaxID=115335 RepID=A0A9W6UXN4_9ACTN|nr:hypothetical protein [Actinomadura rubrobrunea]GLW64880.1 hypothetical protein Arub01_31240 [Actinomadura rubrobrunea]
MRQQISRETFEYLRGYGGKRTYSGIDLDRVKFVSCVLGQDDDPEFGFVVRDVTAKRCRTNACTVHGVRFEDVTVDGLACDHLSLGGCLFKHVTLKGKIGPILTTPVNTLSEETTAAMNAAMVAYYQDVDWALDISEAEFSDAGFSMVPGELVRRDPETQFLLRREVVVPAMDSLPRVVRIEASRFEDTPFDSIVAVAPRRSKHFERYLAEFQQAREAGLVE